MRIDLWSDLVCPWCAIGKAHLDQALQQFEHADDTYVIWRSFELDPGAPASTPASTSYGRPTPSRPTEGRVLSDDSTLQHLAEEVGLVPEKIRHTLAGDASAPLKHFVRSESINVTNTGHLGVVSNCVEHSSIAISNNGPLG